MMHCDIDRRGFHARDIHARDLGCNPRARPVQGNKLNGKSVVEKESGDERVAECCKRRCWTRATSCIGRGGETAGRAYETGRPILDRRLAGSAQAAASPLMNISGARGSEASARRFRRDGAVKQISIAISTFGYDIFGEAMAIQNGVPQGLSSWIFTLNLREADAFLYPADRKSSDCLEERHAPATRR